MLLPSHYNPIDAPSTFSGADIKAVVTIHGRIKVLGELQTISYSVHREKPSVMLMGKINPAGFTRGPRTIAGSMVFTVFNHEVLQELMEMHPEDAVDGGFGTILSDQIPPFNITISFVNEDGHLSSLVIYGVDIVDDGQTMSINDMILENIKSYKARGLDLMWETPDGVWTNKSGTAPKVDSRAVFTSLPTLDKTLGSNTLAEYQSLLYQIEVVEKEILELDSEHAAMTIGGSTVYGDTVQNKMDQNRLDRAIKEAELYRLNIKAKQYKVLLTYSNDPTRAKIDYLWRK